MEITVEVFFSDETVEIAVEAENLAGLVDCVTFHNEDNRFCVLRVKARGQRT